MVPFIKALICVSKKELFCYFHIDFLPLVTIKMLPVGQGWSLLERAALCEELAPPEVHSFN